MRNKTTKMPVRIEEKEAYNVACREAVEVFFFWFFILKKEEEEENPSVSVFGRRCPSAHERYIVACV